MLETLVYEGGRNARKETQSGAVSDVSKSGTVFGPEIREIGGIKLPGIDTR
jgi:hypothetical protein